MIQLNLYTTSHCHLCEQAEMLLEELAKQYGLSWLAIEIAGDDSLIEKYGIRIPVIKRTDDNTEINWPFTTNDILALISTESTGH